jgi:hypothetical protein
MESVKAGDGCRLEGERTMEIVTSTGHRAPMGTPWGRADYMEPVADGIMLVMTPRHGGFHLSPERNAQVPKRWRAASFNGLAWQGWYEEDCDWCIVVLTFPEEFDADQRIQAHVTFAAAIQPQLGKGD